MRASRALLAQAATYAELREVLGASPYSARVHVLSRELCDDSLKFIRQTLPEKHTCDVIELNPGIGVWSQSIHEELQPRRHILVEPEKNEYSRWLDPLLNQSASRYRWAPDIQTALDHESGLLSPMITDLGARVGETSSQGRQNRKYTDTLLITANLATTHHRKVGFRGTAAKRFLLSYYRALFHGGENIHRYGMVRLLAWLDAPTRRVIVPITVANQCKQSVQLDSAFSMSVVASPTTHYDKHSHRRRWHDLDAENFEKVLEKQKKSGIEHAPHRRPTPPHPPIDFYEPNLDYIAANRDEFATSSVFVQQLVALRGLLLRTSPDWFVKYEQQMQLRAKSGLKGGRNKGDKEPEEQILYRKLLTRLRTHHKTWEKCTKFVNEHRALWHEFASAYKQGTRFEPGSSDKADKLLEKHADLMARTKAIKHDSQTRIGKAVDDYRSYDIESPSLAWNRREFESMEVDPEEFHPQRKPLAMIDFVPREAHLEQIDTIDKWICFHHVVGVMTTHPRDTLLQSIKRLVPAGHEEFIKTIPDLHNVPKGGWHDLDDLRLRSVPYDFYMQITLAYEKWPHRPSASQLIRIATSMYEPYSGGAMTEKRR